jgi:hypothetical protein
MRLFLALLELHLPASLKKKVLADLFSLTAQAFGVVPPPIRGLSYLEALEAYAMFTQREAERVLKKENNSEVIKRRLYDNARVLGKRLREKLRLRSAEDVLRTSKLLYEILGISFEGRSDGQVTIARCYFSRFYTDRICGLISALDAGVAAGLSGGGKLDFYQKLTEGRDSCKARIVWDGD